MVSTVEAILLVGGAIMTLIVGAAIMIITHIVKSNKEFAGLPNNVNYVVSFDNKGTRGHSIGYELDYTPEKHTKPLRYNCKFKPIDAERDESGKPHKDLLPFDVPITDSHRLVFPRGTISNHVGIVMYLPEDSNQISEVLYSTEIGKTLGKLTNMAAQKDAAVEIASNTDQFITETVRTLQNTKLNQELMEKVKQASQAQQQTTTKSVQREQKDDKK